MFYLNSASSKTQNHFGRTWIGLNGGRAYPAYVIVRPVPDPVTDLDRWFDSSTGGCPVHPHALGCATHLVARYLSGDYTGGLFDPVDHEPPNRITRSDLLAVRSLSLVKFGQDGFRRKLAAALDADASASAVCATRGCTSHVGCLLQQLPLTSTIFTMTPTELALADGPLWNVLAALFTSSVGEDGATYVSKTLARKRPALLPILDIVALARIRDAGGPGRYKGGNWVFLHNEIVTSALVRPGIAGIRAAVTVPAHYQDLRLIDIVVWMRQYVDGRLTNDQGTCQPL